MGTAFAVSENTFITASHVVDGENDIQVVYNGRRYRCRVVFDAERLDVAMLVADGVRDSRPLRLQRELSVGGEVIVYGYPQRTGWEMAPGVVISTNSSLTYKYPWNVRQVGESTSQVRAGYSGGPVVDRKTNAVVGVLTNANYRRSAFKMFSRNGYAMFTKVESIYPQAHRRQ